MSSVCNCINISALERFDASNINASFSNNFQSLKLNQCVVRIEQKALYIFSLTIIEILGVSY